MKIKSGDVVVLRDFTVWIVRGDCLQLTTDEQVKIRLEMYDRIGSHELFHELDIMSINNEIYATPRVL